MALQKQFRGLASFLGLYQGGNLSLDIAPSVIPTIDITDYAEPLEVITVRSTPAAVNTFTIVGTVPEGEAWLVTAMGVLTPAVVGGGGQIQGMMCIEDTATARRIPVSDNNASALTVTAAGQVYSRGIYFNRPLRLAPAQRIGHLLTILTAGPHQIDVTAMIQRSTI